MAWRSHWERGLAAKTEGAFPGRSRCTPCQTKGLSQGSVVFVCLVLILGCHRWNSLGGMMTLGDRKAPSARCSACGLWKLAEFYEISHTHGTN